MAKLPLWQGSKNSLTNTVNSIVAHCPSVFPKEYIAPMPSLADSESLIIVLFIRMFGEDLSIPSASHGTFDTVPAELSRDNCIRIGQLSCIVGFN